MTPANPASPKLSDQREIERRIRHEDRDERRVQGDFVTEGADGRFCIAARKETDLDDIASGRGHLSGGAHNRFGMGRQITNGCTNGDVARDGFADGGNYRAQGSAPSAPSAGFLQSIMSAPCAAARRASGSDVTLARRRTKRCGVVIIVVMERTLTSRGRSDFARRAPCPCRSARTCSGSRCHRIR